MKLAYGIFIGLLVAIFGVVALFAILSFNSSNYLKEQEPFVKAFTFEFSKTWNPSKVERYLSNSMLEQMQGFEGSQGLEMSKSLGRVTDITDFELVNYHAGTQNTIATFRFKAKFEFARGLITVTVVETDSGSRIDGFHVNITDENINKFKSEA